VILLVYERAHQGLESRCTAGKTAMTWLFGTFSCFFLSMCLEGRGLHSSTIQLNLSTLYGIGGVRRECVARVKGVFRVCRVFSCDRHGST